MLGAAMALTCTMASGASPLLHRGSSTAPSLSRISSIASDLLRNAGNASPARGLMPMRGVQEMPSVDGYLGYSEEENFMAGLYTLSDKDPVLKWADPLYQDATLSMQTGWKRGDNVCGFIPYYYSGELVTVIYVEMSYATGALQVFMDRDVNEGAYEICAYNDNDGYIYGYGFDGSGNWHFMRSPGDRPFDTEIIKSLPTMQSQREICSSLTYDKKEKTFYGVNARNKLVTISPLGEQREVMQLGQYNMPYITGLTRAASGDLFYWESIEDAPGSIGEVSYLYSIDTASGTIDEVFEFENGEQYMFFVTPEREEAAKAPAVPQFVSSTFGDGNRSGKVTVALPSAAVDGSALPASIDYKALLDGADYKSGSGAPGSNVELDFTDLGEGLHYITVSATAGELVSESLLCQIYAGEDTPAVPQQVELTAEKVSWLPVTEGAHGGHVDASSISYKVYINGALEGATASTSLAVSLPVSSPLARYKASVEAVAAGKSSEPGYSKAIVVGAPLDLDVSLTPTAQQYNIMQTDDANGDGYGRSYDSEQKCLDSDYAENRPMDDWIFLPAISFPDQEVYYSVSLDAKAKSADYPGEAFSVWFGKQPAPSAMTTQAIGRSVPSASAFATSSGVFAIDAPCVGYIGIHAESVADQYGFQIKNINVRKTDVKSGSPAAPEITGANCAADGSAFAVIDFKFPSSYIDGSPIDKSVELRAEAVTSAGKAETAGHAGESASVKVAAKDGDNSVTLRVFAGELVSPDAKADVFVGYDVPEGVGNLTASSSESMLSMTMTWDAPGRGANGGLVDPDKLEYIIYNYVESGLSGGYVEIARTSETTYTYSVEPGTEMNFVQLGVVASNDKGDNGKIRTVYELLGTPCQLPMTEDFVKGAPLYVPWLIFTPDSRYDADWGVGDLADFIPGEEGFGIIGTGNAAATRGRLGMPRFSTRGLKDVKVAVELWSGANAAPTSILAEAFGSAAPVEVGASEKGEGFRKYTFLLPEEFNNRGWVQLYVDSEFATPDLLAAVSSIFIFGQKSGVEGIASDEAGFRLVAGDGCLCIEGAAGKCVTVCRPDGSIVKVMKSAPDSLMLNLPGGIYMISCGGKTIKAII